MTAVNLPEPIAAYFAADRHPSAQALARCFTAQATVTDEGRTHVGAQAIAAWRANASTQYRYTVEPVAIERDEGFIVVTSHVAGDFPGSPVDLRYRFRLERGLIAALEIGA